MKNTTSKEFGLRRKVAGTYARYGFNKCNMLALLIIGIVLGLLISPYLYHLIILIGVELPPNIVMTLLAFPILLAIGQPTGRLRILTSPEANQLLARRNRN